MKGKYFIFSMVWLCTFIVPFVEGNPLDPNSSHDILTATEGFDKDLQATTQKYIDESNAHLSQIRDSFNNPQKPRSQHLVYYDAQRKLFSVGGHVFDENDEQSALNSEPLFYDPNAQVGRPMDGGDWRAMNRQDFLNYIERLKNPTSHAIEKKKRQIAGIFGSSNYYECILDEMPGVKNDQVAEQLRRACRDEHPNSGYIEKKTSMFGISTSGECILEYAENVTSPKGADLIRSACYKLYPRE